MGTNVCADFCAGVHVRVCIWRSEVDTWISLGRKNRIDFTDRLGMGQDGKRRDQAGGGWIGGRKGESIGRDNWNLGASGW